MLESQPLEQLASIPEQGDRCVNGSLLDTLFGNRNLTASDFINRHEYWACHLNFEKQTCTTHRMTEAVGDCTKFNCLRFCLAIVQKGMSRRNTTGLNGNGVANCSCSLC